MLGFGDELLEDEVFGLVRSKAAAEVELEEDIDCPVKTHLDILSVRATTSMRGEVRFGSNPYSITL